MNACRKSDLIRRTVRALLFTSLLAATGYAATGILSSQIGYDCGDLKRVLIRSSDSTYLGSGATFEVQTKANAVVSSGSIVKWGRRWHENWWSADFTSFDAPGTYKLVVKNGATVVATGDTFQIQDSLLWKKTWYEVSIRQLDARAAIARNNQGWQDCGSPLREANSHATAIIALLDLLEFAAAQIPDSAQQRIIWHIKRGTDYLALCQDQAKANGAGDGPLVHEIPDHSNIVTGDIAKAALVFARASRALQTNDPARSADYLARSLKAFNWLRAHGPDAKVTVRR